MKFLKNVFQRNVVEDDDTQLQPEETSTTARGPVTVRQEVTPVQAATKTQPVAPPARPVVTSVSGQPVAPPVQPDSTVKQQQSVPSLEKINGELSLVRYSPAELLQQVHNENEHVEFGQSRITKTMDVYGEVWSLIGPVVLLVGTIGEVFLVLWIRQKNQQIWTALSIIAVAMVLEGTFLAVSYKTATIRNRADKRPDGRTDGDKRKLHTQLGFWITLAIGVCFTQIVFIIAQTNPDGLDQTAIILFAIARSFFTLIADGYTAFAHEEMPTTGDRLLEEKEQRTKHTNLALNQKIHEINIINNSQLALLQAHSEAQIKHEKLQTQLEAERLQNKSLLDAMIAQQTASTMFANTGSGIIRALFDVSMPDDQRAKMLATMSGFMGAVKQVPGAQDAKLLSESVPVDALQSGSQIGNHKEENTSEITVDAVRFNPQSFKPKSYVNVTELFSQEVDVDQEKSTPKIEEKVEGKVNTFETKSADLEEVTFLRNNATQLPDTGAFKKFPNTDPALQVIKNPKDTRKLSLDELELDQKDDEKVTSSVIPPKQPSIRPRHARVSNTRLTKNLYSNSEAAKAAKCSVHDIEQALESGELLTAKNSDKILKSSLEKFIQEIREKRAGKLSLVK